MATEGFVSGGKWYELRRQSVEYVHEGDGGSNDRRTARILPFIEGNEGLKVIFCS